jgi:uncharacterized membrane protein YesL
MHLIFEHDSPIMQFLNRFSSLIILNILFLCTCIPIFTIGASLTALYDVVFRLDTPREGKTVSTYFQSFRKNFKQSTPVWLVFLLLIVTSCINITYFSGLGSPLGHVLFVLSVVILINSMLVLGFAFPLISQFDNTLSNTLKNALLLSTAHLPRTLIVAVINCFPWMLMLLNFYAFIQLSFLWVALYFAAAAYFNSRVLMKIFDLLKEQSAK